MTPPPSLRFVLLLLLGIGAVQAQRPRSSSTLPPVPSHPATPYAITGTVVSSIDGSPVQHCHLAATLVVRSSSTRQFPAPGNAFDCEEHGRFSCPLPSAGAWSLTASAVGFIAQAYEQHQQFSTALVLTAANPTINIQFQISPEAVITGIVLDEAGEAVRNAQVSLQMVPALGPDGIQQADRIRSTTRTDDRGLYELSGIAPGAYRVAVQAQPWYAAAAQGNRRSPVSNPPLDPSLDLAYPVTWFPGVDNSSLAETITVQAGDTRQADFHLIPIPSLHLRILPAPGPLASDGRPTPFFPIVQQVIPGGGLQSMPAVSLHTDPQGQVDVGGLAPGLYQIRVMGSNQTAVSSLVEVATGSTRTLDLATPSNEASIGLHFDGLPDAQYDSAPLQVNFIDTETGHGNLSSTSREEGLHDLSRPEQRAHRSDRTVNLLPSRYEVILQGRPDLYLTGITARKAEAVGRYVTVSSGACDLTLHLASGRASLTGIAAYKDRPSSGALVLLVPTTIDDPGFLRIIRRDQTDSDGSFNLPDVIPGQYILVVVDHGWHINWSDPSTLRHYLTQGVPIDLTSPSGRQQDLTAQAP